MGQIARRTFMAGAAAALGASPAAAKPKLGEPAGSFRLITYTGEKIASADLAGQVVLINYWALWCGPCRNELVAFDRFARAHADKGLRIFAVNLDEDIKRTQLEALSQKLTFPVVTWMAGRGYGTLKGAVPTNYVIDRSGVLRYAAAGAFDAAGLRDVIGPLLADRSPTPGAQPT